MPAPELAGDRGLALPSSAVGVIASLSLDALPQAARDPSNAFDGRADAAALGKRLFGNQAAATGSPVNVA